MIKFHRNFDVVESKITTFVETLFVKFLREKITGFIHMLNSIHYLIYSVSNCPEGGPYSLLKYFFYFYILH
jgi:hypothetical protein